MSPTARGSIVFCGLTTLDVIHGLSEPLQPGRKMVASGTEIVAGGPAANAAVVAAALGETCSLVTMIGTSPAADIAAEDLRRSRVTVLDHAPPGWAIPVASAIIDPSGERTVASTGALAGSDRTLSEEAREAAVTASVVLVDGHHPSLAEQVLSVVSGRTVVVLDAGSAKPHAEAWLPRVDVLAASADYAAGLGLSARETIAHGLSAGVSAVVVTRGAAPILVGTSDGGSFEVPVASVVARDTLGAGDAFHGALVAGLATGPLTPDLVSRAAQVATLRVQHAGARAWLAHVG